MSEKTTLPALPHNTGPNPPTGRARFASRVAWVTAIATLGGLLFGYDTGVTNGALGFIVDYFALGPLSEGLITFCLLIGAALGAAAGGKLADAVGRRRLIRVMAILFIVGTVGCAAAVNIEMLLLFRFVLGLAVGVSSMIVPTYIGEVAPQERRGSMVSLNEFMLVTGQFLAFVMNAVIGNVWGGNDSVWRWMLLIAMIPATILLLGMVKLPESPRWLASQGREDEALAVLRTLRTADRAETELAQIRDLTRQRAAEQTVNLGQVLSTRWMRSLLLTGLGVAAFQQTTGVNSVMYYGTQVLEEAGFERNAALSFNVLNGVVAVAAVGIALLLMNRIKRRTVMLAGYSGVALIHVVIGLVGSQMDASNPLRGYLLMALIVAFIGVMQGCLGPTLFVVLAELFPVKARGLMLGISMFALWVVNSIVALIFPSLVAAFGFGTFWLFAVVCSIAVVFVALRVPETHGRSLEELEASFQQRLGD